MLGLIPRRSVVFALGLLSMVAPGCAQLGPVGVSSTAPAVAVTEPAPVAIVPTALPDAVAMSAMELPAVGGCSESDVTDDDDRCPEQIVHAAAMSWLGKTTAIYDGVRVEVLEYDPAEVRAEAQRDVMFREMMAAADAAPTDGQLDGAEARILEASVLDHIDARYAAR